MREGYRKRWRERVERGSQRKLLMKLMFCLREIHTSPIADVHIELAIGIDRSIV